MNAANTRTWTSFSLPEGTPSVPTTSRGLRYGDGVFVTLAIRSGVLLDAELQMGRLHDAAAAIGLIPPDGFDNPVKAANRLAAVVSGFRPAPSDGVARMQLFGGPGPRGFGRGTIRADALIDVSSSPNVRSPSIVILPDGLVPLPTLPHYKTCSALANVLCAREAARRGVDAAVRVSGGALLETGSANVFWYREHTLFTPSDSLPLYAGSVRTRILECAPVVGLEVKQGEYGANALCEADAVLLVPA